MLCSRTVRYIALDFEIYILTAVEIQTEQKLIFCISASSSQYLFLTDSSGFFYIIKPIKVALSEA